MTAAEIAAKLAALTGKGEKVKTLWKPTGTHNIRLVPFSDGTYFKDLFFHYEILPKQSILSPLSYSDGDTRDPIAAFGEKLAPYGSSKEDWKLAQKFKPKTRYYAAILVRGEENQGVKFWAFGKETYTKILTLLSKPDFEDLLDLEKGIDLELTFTPGKGDLLASTDVTPRRNSSPAVPKDQPNVANLIKNQPNLFDNWRRYTYNELVQILDNFTKPENSETVVTVAPASSVADVPTSGQFDLPKATTAKSKTVDIDSELDAVFNKK